MTIRIDSTPPPQQRIMIVDAIVHEWKRLPVRKYATLLYKSNLQIIRGTIEAIKANPPTYATLINYMINRLNMFLASKCKVDTM